jgi:hypothetical protein
MNSSPKNLLAQSRGELSQHDVARPVAQAVLDRLEPVDVGHYHGEPATGLRRLVDHVGQACGGHGPVGEPRQGVQAQLSFEGLLGELHLGHVPHGPQHHPRRTVPGRGADRLHADPSRPVPVEQQPVDNVHGLAGQHAGHDGRTQLFAVFGVDDGHKRGHIDLGARGDAQYLVETVGGRKCLTVRALLESTQLHQLLGQAQLFFMVTGRFLGRLQFGNIACLHEVGPRRPVRLHETAHRDAGPGHCPVRMGDASFETPR